MKPRSQADICNHFWVPCLWGKTKEFAILEQVICPNCNTSKTLTNNEYYNEQTKK